MKKLEDWFLDRFMPWFMEVSQYVGILAVLFGLSYCFGKSLGWEVFHIFIMTPIIGFFLFVINAEAKDSRLMRQINDILDDENDNILKIGKEGHLIDHQEFDRIVSRIHRELGPETLASHISEEEGSNKVYNKINKAVWSRYLSISRKNKKIEEANTQRSKNNEQKGA